MVQTLKQLKKEVTLLLTEKEFLVSSTLSLSLFWGYFGLFYLLIQRLCFGGSSNFYLEMGLNPR